MCVHVTPVSDPRAGVGLSIQHVGDVQSEKVLRKRLAFEMMSMKPTETFVERKDNQAEQVRLPLLS